MIPSSIKTIKHIKCQLGELEHYPLLNKEVGYVLDNHIIVTTQCNVEALTWIIAQYPESVNGVISFFPLYQGKERCPENMVDTAYLLVDLREAIARRNSMNP